MENKSLEKIFQYCEENKPSLLEAEDSEMMVLNDEQARALYGGMSDFICWDNNCNSNCTDNNCVDSNCTSDKNCGGNDSNCNLLCW